MATEHDDLLQRVASMSREELDELPVGVIELDLDGTIREYNRKEASMAHRDAKTQIGKNFFRDVAPCTAHPDFEGRLRALAEPDAFGSVNFRYRFTFPWGDNDVHIDAVRAKGADSMYVVVTWKLDI